MPANLAHSGPSRSHLIYSRTAGTARPAHRARMNPAGLSVRFSRQLRSAHRLSSGKPGPEVLTPRTSEFLDVAGALLVAVGMSRRVFTGGTRTVGVSRCALDQPELAREDP